MNLKSERGSVTIYVLSVTICITLILLSIFVGMMNKNSSQYKQIEQIYNEYAGESNNEKIDNVYEDTINATNGRVQISANFYKQSGEKYDLSEYTNESLTLKVSCSGGSNGEKAKITIGNKVVEYTSQGITIDENCVIKIVYSGKQKTITVNGIDKTAPTVAMSPNGGTGYVMPTTGKATIKTTLTASDVGESGIKTKQYAWSTSNATEPTEGWTDFENGKEISKTDCTQGDYYLWTKVLDGAGNRAEKVKVSNVFTVTDQTIDESKITIALSTEDWTNKDVTAVITYGKNLTQNRKAGFGTANIANAMTVTATENGTIYAEATDRAGNKVVVTKQVTKIDKKAPTIPTITAKLDSDAGNAYDGTWTNKPVVISAQAIDEASKINRIEYSYDNTTWKTDWGNSLVTNGNTSSIKGTWNSNYDKTVYVRAVDNAGNASGSSSMILKQDTAKPEISTITNSSNGNWTNSDVVVTLNGTDNLSGIKEFQWFENNAWTTRDLSTKAGVGTITYTADRDLNIRFRVIDNAGNISEEKTSQVRIDKVKPSAPVITNTSDGKWTNKNVTITLKSTDANSGIAKYQLKYSGTNGAWKDVSNPDTWSEERNETVYYRAVDNAGNVSAESSTVIKIDKTAPTKPTYVSRYQDKTAYTSGTWTNKTVYTDITTEDKASGVAKIQYSFDNSTWGDLSLLASSGIQVSGTKATGTEEWTLEDRNNNVWFRAVDNVGNVSEASDVFNVRYDLSGPTSLVVTAKLNSDTGDIYDGNWTNKPVVISAQATDEASQINRIEYSYDNATWKTDWGTNLVTNGNTSSIKGTWNSNYNTTVYVRAVDNMGNASESKSVVLKQDTTAPAAPTLTNSSNGNWTKDSVKVTLASTDAGSGVAKYQVKYSGTNGTWNDVSNPDPWSAERNETVYYRAVDNAGNVSAESSTAIKIDKTAPVKPTYVSRYADKTAYTSGTWTNKTAYTDITTEDKASGVAKIQYSFDNSTWGDLSLLASSGIQVSGKKATGTEEWTLKDRNNNVWFRAVDNVGNVSEASDVFNVKYDLTAPTASKTEVKNLTATGYDVYVYNVADAGSGVHRVQFPTWTESNGQDDIISDWVTNSKSTGIKQSDGTTWVYHVNTTDHKNEYGKYNTHIYAYDNLGNSKMIGNVEPTVPGVTVTYNYSENGGTSATKTSATVGYNLAVDLTPTATKSGYTFVGWNTNKDATTALSSLNAPASGATLYAIFKKDITATYKYWNGSAATSTTKSATVYNKTTSATITAPTLANSSKDGITYTARGWSTSNTGNATIAVTSGGSQTISANTTYYGAYQATITATFYYHKGTDQYARAQTSVEASGIRYMNSSGAYINSNITIPTEVTASTGYYGTQYKGVASAVSSSTAVTPNTGTTKYYAFYNVEITYYYYNGSAHTSSTGIRTATTDGSTYSNKVDKEPTPSNYDGAAFSHWSYAVTKYSDDYKRTPTTTAMLALYAVYQKTVTATFYYHGGTDQYTATQTSTTATGTRYYISKSGGVNTYNNNISIPSAVTSSTGYYGTTYKGVAAAKSSSTSATPTTATTAYYAFYNVGITYYYYNGSAQTKATSTRRATSNGTTYVATVDSEPSTPNYDGATFSHWSYDATKYSADYERTPAATAVLELYAVYSKTVTATFNYYNGSAAATTTASGTKYYISKSGGVNTYNNNINVPSAVSSSKGPSGIAYSHISTTRTGSATTPNTSTGIYYAVYKKTVTATKKEYNNKTSNLTGTAYGYYDGKVTNASINLGTSTASGYTFRGWSTSTTADATTVNATVSLVNNTTYYASYSSTPTISLTYNANSGSGAPGGQTGKITRYMNYVGTTKNSGSVTFTVSTTKPTRSGYTFVSWNTKSDGTGTSYASGATLNTSANVTLYAIWEKEAKVGDIISLTSTKGTTERFYVLSYDESTQKAKALAEWNLKVGNIYNNGSSTAIATDSDGYGLQNKEMKGWAGSGQPSNGVLAFSNSLYFKDTFADYPVDKDGKSYVYDSNSNLYTYVNKYKELLGNTDKVSEVSLASYADTNALWSNRSNYSWLYSTTFWLGSAIGASSNGVWYVNTAGNRHGTNYNYSYYCGVRPVITIDISKI